MAGWKINPLVFNHEVKKAITDLPLDSLGLTCRMVNTLKMLDIITVSDLLLKLPPDNVMRKYRNVGTDTIKDIHSLQSKFQKLVNHAEL